MRRNDLRPALLALLVPGALAVACAPAMPSAELSPRAGDTRAEISADDLRLRIGILAHDSMRGRDTGTPGAAAAARYLVAEVARLGLRPAGDDGTFLNRSPLQRRGTRAELQVTRTDGSWSPGLDEVVPAGGILGLPASSRERGEGPLVYAGHLVDPEIGAGELRADQLTGASVLIRLSPAPGVDPSTTPPRFPLAALFGPTSPAAAILLVVEQDGEEMWAHAAGLARTGVVELPAARAVGQGAQIFLVSPAFAERVLGAPLAAARSPRTELGTFSYSIREEVTPVEAWNVVAALPGRDAARAGQYVTLGAHYDHVGTGTPVNGDSIYNGADDNASGTSALLEVAEQLASLPLRERPARSILFIWYTGEEHGLLGSRTFTDSPTVPRDSIVVNINADMVGRNHADSLFVIGASRASSRLGSIVEEANRAKARPFILDYSYDAPGHPEMLFCRSDHYNFARFGIPIAFFTTGLHEDYHRPSDTPEKIDYEKTARVARLISGISRTVADLPGRLPVDRPAAAAAAECMM